MVEPACAWLLALAISAPPADSAPAAEEPPPSRELLLYLAEFGDADDRHVDPAEVDTALEQARKRADPAPETTAPEPDPDPDATHDSSP